MSRVLFAACQFLVLIAIVSTAIAAAPGPRKAAIRSRQMTAGPDSIRFQEVPLRTNDLQASEMVIGRRGDAKSVAHRATIDVEDGFLHWRGKTPPAILIPTEIRSNSFAPARGTR
jgi:hypothetical protein